jgi:hypothetical protein
MRYKGLRLMVGQGGGGLKSGSGKNNPGIVERGLGKDRSLDFSWARVAEIAASNSAGRAFGSSARQQVLPLRMQAAHVLPRVFT